MRISMWMLADWLKKYEPDLRIRQGDRTLQNARLFSDERRISRSTVYLDQIQNDRIVCSSGHDILVLHASDVNEVFNEILDAFEFYNDWSSDAHDLIHRGCSLSELLELGARALGRALILADATFYMREVVIPEGLNLPDLPGMARRRLLPLETLLSLGALPHIRVPNLPSYRISPPGIRPAAAITNLFTGAEHKGWLVTVNESGSYTQGELDLQDAFGELLVRRLEQSAFHGERMERSGVFQALLEGRPDGAERGEERLKALGWYPADRKQVYLLSEPAAGQELLPSIERHLAQVNPYAVLLRHEGRLLYVMNHRITPPEPFEAALCPVLARCGCAAGKSPAFTDMSRLPECYRAALVALRYSAEKPGTVHSFEEAILPYSAKLLRETSPFDLRHPALIQLEEYDALHEGNLKETLRLFLQNRCGYTDTAEALFIHRSTLLYRLRRIQELTGLNLDSYETRLHLALSYLIGQ